MLRSENIAQLVEALALAQGEFPIIPRDRTVTVTPRKRQDGYQPPSYSFSYAPLDTILGCVRPALSKHGLSLVQGIVAEGDAEFLRTQLFHKSGEWISNDQPLFEGSGDNKSQAYAAGLTYARRYGVTTLLCVAADEDDDGNSEEFQRITPRGKAGQRPSRPAGKAPEAPAVDTSGEPGIYDLSESQKRLLVAKAKGALPDHEEGVEAAIVAKFNRVTPANLNAVLAELRNLAEASA